MCHHFEPIAELDAEEREALLEAHSDEELEDELRDEELEALVA